MEMDVLPIKDELIRHTFVAFIFRLCLGTCCMSDGPDQVVGVLTGIAGEAYWIQRHGCGDQEFGNWAEMGLHGNALEVDRVGAQYLGGVYWKTLTNTPKRDKEVKPLWLKTQ